MRKYYSGYCSVYSVKVADFFSCKSKPEEHILKLIVPGVNVSLWVRLLGSDMWEMCVGLS